MSQYPPSYDPNGMMRTPPPEQERQVRVSLPKLRPVITYTLVGATVAVYALQLLSQYLFNGNDWLFYYGGKINEFILQGQLWRLITPILLHGSIFHIGFNMYALFIFGPELERAYGHWRYLLLYLLAGFAGNVLSFLMTPSPSLGASTAIFGLVSAEAVFVYQNRTLFGRRARQVLLNLLLVVVINFGLGLSPGSLVDNFGHLGGLIGGAIFAWFAGPKWVLDGIYPSVKVVDERSLTQVQFGAILVLFIFGGLTLVRFLFVK
jgi:rhomboid protease GluP